MIKLYKKALCFYSLFNLTLAFGITPVATNTQDDPNGVCYNLMLQANNNPPTTSASSDEISNVETCLSNCDQLYNYYGQQGQNDTMLQGISYCRNNLSALYYQEIYSQTYANINQTVSASSGTVTPAVQTISEPIPASPDTPLTSPPLPPATGEGSTTHEKRQSQPKSINWF